MIKYIEPDKCIHHVKGNFYCDEPVHIVVYRDNAPRFTAFKTCETHTNHFVTSSTSPWKVYTDEEFAFLILIDGPMKLYSYSEYKRSAFNG
jgi:hypothetical protein